VILSSGLNVVFLDIKSLSTKTSTLTQAHEFGLIADKSEKIFSHVLFLSNFATPLATAAISCLRTLEPRL